MKSEEIYLAPWQYARQTYSKHWQATTPNARKIHSHGLLYAAMRVSIILMKLRQNGKVSNISK